VIGGHGDVMQGKDKFELWKQYFRDLMTETAEAYAAGATREDAEQSVSKALISKYSGKFDPSFPHDVMGNIDKAYEVVAQR
jgi:hypothetical protein